MADDEQDVVEALSVPMCVNPSANLPIEYRARDRHERQRAVGGGAASETGSLSLRPFHHRTTVLPLRRDNRANQRKRPFRQPYRKTQNARAPSADSRRSAETDECGALAP
jgi:hypothetical protein